MIARHGKGEDFAPVAKIKSSGADAVMPATGGTISHY
jgi:hypothetical protein